MRLTGYNLRPLGRPALGSQNVAHQHEMKCSVPDIHPRPGYILSLKSCYGACGAALFPLAHRRRQRGLARRKDRLHSLQEILVAWLAAALDRGREAYLNSRM